MLDNLKRRRYEAGIAAIIDRQLGVSPVGQFLTARFIQLEPGIFNQLHAKKTDEGEAAVHVCSELLKRHADEITTYNGAPGAALQYLRLTSVKHPFFRVREQARQAAEDIFQMSEQQASLS